MFLSLNIRMGNCDIVFRYFPEMSERQRGQIEALEALYGEWNARINVISRRDIDNLYTAHILNSLAKLRSSTAT